MPYILGAAKPSRRKLRQAVDGMNLPVDQVAMVGDRLFTDVLAGNRLGMFTILVEPSSIPKRSARLSNGAPLKFGSLKSSEPPLRRQSNKTQITVTNPDTAKYKENIRN